MSETIVQELAKDLEKALSNKQVIIKDGSLKVIIGNSIAEISIDIRRLIDALLSEYSSYKATYERLKSKLNELENRLLDLLHEVGSPELVSYIRHKIYGGRPGFSLGVKVSGDKVYLYKIVSKSGTKRWYSIGIALDYGTWDLIKSLIDDISELRELLDSIPQQIRSVYDPIQEITASLSIIRDSLFKLYAHKLLPEPPKLSVEEDDYYLKLLELEAKLIRKRRSKKRSY